MVCVTAVIGCGNQSAQDPNVSESETVTQEEITDESSETDVAETEVTQSLAASNILIAYFSRVGITDLSGDVDAVSSASINTQGDGYIGNATILANMIAEKTGGDETIHIQVSE